MSKTLVRLEVFIKIMDNCGIIVSILKFIRRIYRGIRFVNKGFPDFKTLIILWGTIIYHFYHKIIILGGV